jgi:hypothetical protein
MSACPRCGTVFECGMVDASAMSEPCWCTRMPLLPSGAYATDKGDEAAGRCFCPGCLRALLDASDVDGGSLAPGK